MTHKISEEDFAAVGGALGNDAQLFEGRRVLITGGSGFLGASMVGVLHFLNRRVLQRPCRVLSLDNYITGSRAGLLGEFADEHIRVEEADVSLPLNIRENFDFIIHAAGIASPAYYRKFPLETIDAAVAGTKNLLEYARRNPAASFLFLSSSEIYGDPAPEFIPTSEHYRGNVSCTGPRACYDESKRLAETLCMTYRHLYGMPIKIVRPFNVYGPGIKQDDYRVIPAFIARSLAGEPLPVHGKGDQTRTFCYVSDAIAGFLKVLLSGTPGEPYNVGTDKEEISMKDLALHVRDAAGSASPIQCVDYPDTYPADEPRRRCPDLSKIKGELGYGPTVDLRTGLGRTIQWWRDTYGGAEKNRG